VVRAGQLWIAERNYCTVEFLHGLAAGAKFINRQHGQLDGTPVGKPRRSGATETGAVWEKEFRTPEHAGQALRIRRVLVKLRQATRDGDREIAVLTNLSVDEANATTVSAE
jgi:hypothetical protein